MPGFTPPVTPPTDNLYKFIAIAGMLLMAFSALYPLYYIDSKQEQLLKWDTEEKMKTLDLTTASENIPDLTAEASLLNAKAKDLLKEGKIDEAAQDALQAHTLYQRNTAQLRDSSNAMQKQILEYGLQAKFLDIATRDVKTLFYFCIAGMFVGLAMTLIGFDLWYYKVQRYQDYILKNSATKEGYIETPLPRYLYYLGRRMDRNNKIVNANRRALEEAEDNVSAPVKPASLPAPAEQQPASTPNSDK